MPPALDVEVAAEISKQHVSPVALAPIPVGDALTRRRIREAALEDIDQSIAPGVSTTDIHVPGADGNLILCRWYHKQMPLNTPTAAVLYLHGGGHILGNVTHFDGVCSRYVANTSISILSIDYRLAPEHPYPASLQDAYASFVWLHSNASKLHIDPSRIGVMGDSAGGGLAASLVHYCIHNGGPAIAKQILIYPMLDNQTTSAPTDLEPFLVWTVDDNVTSWNAFLGSLGNFTDELPPWAVPSRMTTVPEGMPEMYLEVAELDLFREENELYAARLAEAGVKVEVKMRPGCPHGWEHIAPNAGVTKQAMEDRRLALSDL